MPGESLKEFFTDPERVNEEDLRKSIQIRKGCIRKTVGIYTNQVEVNKEVVHKDTLRNSIQIHEGAHGKSTSVYTNPHRVHGESQRISIRIHQGRIRKALGISSNSILFTVSPSISLNSIHPVHFDIVLPLLK